MKMKNVLRILLFVMATMLICGGILAANSTIVAMSTTSPPALVSSTPAIAPTVVMIDKLPTMFFSGSIQAMVSPQELSSVYFDINTPQMMEKMVTAQSHDAVYGIGAVAKLPEVVVGTGFETTYFRNITAEHFQLGHEVVVVISNVVGVIGKQDHLSYKPAFMAQHYSGYAIV
ncbi:MAG: hypothetical protein NTZ42_02035 [Candidatus Gribaldobacteria bacterium]|nr:hypothetical protein [Candidatus Gribaldobacteria bacterium]